MVRIAKIFGINKVTSEKGVMIRLYEERRDDTGRHYWYEFDHYSNYSQPTSGAYEAMFRLLVRMYNLGTMELGNK